MTRWGFLSVLVVAVGAVAAFGITWGWRKDVEIDPETIPPPPGLWRPEFAELRLTQHTLGDLPRGR